MIWAKIDSEFIGFAWKRLTPHEIDPAVSRGHEFQGINGLANLLGREGRRGISTDYYLMDDDKEGNPSVKEVIHSTASWYDGREKDGNRSAEWRLYYPAEAGAIQAVCSAGDLMIVGLRRDSTLAIMLIAAGSSTEAAITNILGIGRLPEEGSGNIRSIKATDQDIGLSAAETLESLYSSFLATASPGTRALFPPPEPDLAGDDSAKRLADKLLSRWPTKLGSCEDIVSEIFACSGVSAEDRTNSPDKILLRWLELGEMSYRIWEKEVFGHFLQPIRNNSSIDDLELADRISEKWMSFRQSRVSRAGRVLELCLVEIFSSWGIRFGWQQVLPGNKRPDFIFPGKAEYENEAFPSDQLRLLGAKTSLKERWKQILAEGPRVDLKHGITRDDSISSATFHEMETCCFTVVMPQPVISLYSKTPRNLISVADFLQELKEIQNLQ